MNAEIRGESSVGCGIVLWRLLEENSTSFGLSEKELDDVAAIYDILARSPATQEDLRWHGSSDPDEAALELLHSGEGRLACIYITEMNRLFQLQELSDAALAVPPTEP